MFSSRREIVSLKSLPIQIICFSKRNLNLRKSWIGLKNAQLKQILIVRRLGQEWATRNLQVHHKLHLIKQTTNLAESRIKILI